MATHVYDAVVIGTGFAGLGMGIKLKEAGITNFIILEKAGDVGGTWRDNHYPGAACDVPSRLYSFSFEPNYRWSRMFSPQKEIYDYMRHCAEKYGMYAHIKFKQAVASAEYNAESFQWRVKTEAGSEFLANAYINCTGGLSRPAYPNIPGLETFRGKIMHSADWDHSVDLQGKRVGVIGTGASAIQIVPTIADKTQKLFLFQRTAAWVVPKFDRPFSEEEKRKLEELPLRERWARLKLYCRLESIGYFLRYPSVMRQVQKLFTKIIESKVQDPELRRKLTPDYVPGCKRILFSDDYFEGVQKPQVEVVTEGIARVTEKGIELKNGQQVEFDILICATGFKASEDLAPFPIRGRNGLDLSVVWQKRAEAYRGTTVHGFPNFFLIIGPNTGLGHTSIVLMIEAQIRYVIETLRYLKANQLKEVEVKSDSQDQYNRKLRAQLAGMVWAKGGCVSWYNTSQGENTTLWPRSTLAFRLQLMCFDKKHYQFKK